MGYIKLVEYYRPQVDNPVLIQGLPGVGLVGKLTADFLIKQFKPEKFASIFSEYLTLPSGALGVLLKSRNSIEIYSYDFYHIDAENADLILLTAEVQPTTWGQYPMANQVLDFFKRLGGTTVVTMGGNVVQRYENTVYACASNAKLLKMLSKYRVLPLQGGEVTGACGLLAGLAPVKGMDSFCLLSSTRGAYPDPKAARRLLKVIDAMYGINVDYSIVNKAIKDIEMTLTLRREMNRIIQRARGEIKPRSREEIPYRG